MARKPSAKVGATVEATGADYSPGNNGAGPAAHETGAFEMIETGLITASPWNPRTRFDEAGDNGLQALADSIRQFGILEPLVVRKSSRPLILGWELIAGERRLRASKMVGLKQVPCIIREMDDRTAKLATTIENLQRKQLDIFDEANAYKILSDEGMKQADIAAQVGYSQSRIAKVSGLLRLPPAVQDLIREEKLSPSHGERLLSLAKWPEVCVAVAQFAAANGTAASDVEKPKDWPYKLQSIVAALPSVRRLHYDTTFDHEKVCAKCPFDARRKVGYQSLCFNAEHYDELETAAKAVKEEKQRQLMEQARQAGEATRSTTPLPMAPSSDDADDEDSEDREDRAADVPESPTVATPPVAEPVNVPYLRNLPDAVDLKHHEEKRGGLPEGCDGETCACRGIARGWGNQNGDLITVCLNKRHFDSLIDAQKEREKDARRAEVRALTPRLLPVLNSPDAPPALLSCVVTRLAVSVMVGTVRSDYAEAADAAADYHGIALHRTFAQMTDKGYGIQDADREALRTCLAQYDALHLLRFIGDFIVRAEWAKYIETGYRDYHGNLSTENRLYRDLLALLPETALPVAEEAEETEPPVPMLERIPLDEGWDGPAASDETGFGTHRLPPGQRSTWYQWCGNAGHDVNERRGLAWRAYMAGWTGGEFSRGKRGSQTLEDLTEGASAGSEEEEA